VDRLRTDAAGEPPEVPPVLSQEPPLPFSSAIELEEEAGFDSTKSECPGTIGRQLRAAAASISVVHVAGRFPEPLKVAPVGTGCDMKLREEVIHGNGVPEMQSAPSDPTHPLPQCIRLGP
jgi:hypothetical protein